MGEYSSLQNALFTQSHTIRSTFLITSDFKQFSPSGIRFYYFLLVFIKNFTHNIHIADSSLSKTHFLFPAFAHITIYAFWNIRYYHMGIHASFYGYRLKAEKHIAVSHLDASRFYIGNKKPLCHFSGLPVLE